MSSIYYTSRVLSQPGAKKYWRATGTSTPQNVYTDIGLSVAHANPTVADADGYFPVVYFDPSLPNYRVIHTDGSNVDDDPTLEVLLEPTLDDVPSSNNQAQTYTVKGTRPRILLWETDAGTNAKKWYLEVNGETLVISEVNDAESSATVLFSLPRGTVVQTAPLSSSGATLSIASLKVGHTALIFKTSTTIRTSTTTQAADPVLQFTSAVAGTYLVEGQLFFTSPSAANVALAWPRITGVAGTIAFVGYDSLFAPIGTALEPLLMSSTAQTLDTTVNITYIGNVYGVETATAGQTLGPTWSQGTSNAGNTSLLAGSWLKVTRLT